MPDLDVLLIGAVNYDIYVPHNIGNSVETTSFSDGISMEIGGGASITAIALATLGMRAAVAGSVGKHAGIILEELRIHNVKNFLRQYVEVETSITVADHYPDGIKRYRANTQSNSLFTPQDLKEVLPHVEQSRLVMRTGYPWMPQIAGRPTAELFDYARKQDIITALDMSNPDLWDGRMLEELVSDVVPNTYLLCANEKELHRLARKTDEPLIGNSELEEYMVLDRVLEFAHRLLARGVKLVNVHYGPNGTVLVTRDIDIHEMPPHVSSYINPTGCGNLQNAGIIDSILNGTDLHYAARLGNVLAALRLEGTPFPTREAAQMRMLAAYSNR